MKVLVLRISVKMVDEENGFGVLCRDFLGRFSAVPLDPQEPRHSGGHILQQNFQGVRP